MGYCFRSGTGRFEVHPHSNCTLPSAFEVSQDLRTQLHRRQPRGVLQPGQGVADPGMAACEASEQPSTSSSLQQECSGAAGSWQSRHRGLKHSPRCCGQGLPPKAQLPYGWAVAACLCVLMATQASAARLVSNKQGTAPDTIRAWQSLLQQSEFTAFNDAFEATYNGTGPGDAARTLMQYEDMVSWLVTAPIAATAQIHELHNYAVRELVYDAVQLANKPFNETSALAVLEYISSRLAQVRHAPSGQGIALTEANGSCYLLPPFPAGLQQVWLPRGPPRHRGLHP